MEHPTLTPWLNLWTNPCVKSYVIFLLAYIINLSNNKRSSFTHRGTTEIANKADLFHTNNASKTDVERKGLQLECHFVYWSEKQIKHQKQRNPVAKNLKTRLEMPNYVAWGVCKSSFTGCRNLLSRTTTKLHVQNTKFHSFASLKTIQSVSGI